MLYILSMLLALNVSANEGLKVGTVILKCAVQLNEDELKKKFLEANLHKLPDNESKLKASRYLVNSEVLSCLIKYYEINEK